jgi:CBS domain-containing protein
MNVGRICKRQLVTVTPRTDLVAAAELMREHHVGFVVVVEPQPPSAYGRPIGVLTDRDIVVCVVAGAADPKLLRVADVMNPDPVTIDEAESLDHALRIMRRMGIRRLPVVGSRGMLSGVVSLDDIIDLLGSEIADVVGAVRNEQRIERVQR